VTQPAVVVLSLAAKVNGPWLYADVEVHDGPSNVYGPTALAIWEFWVTHDVAAIKNKMNGRKKRDLDRPADFPLISAEIVPSEAL